MNTKIFYSYIILLVLSTPALVYTQTDFQTGAHFSLGFPQNEFKVNVESIGYGLSGYFAYHFPRSPVLIGGSGGFLIYGSETREEPFSTTIPDVYVDVTTTNSIIMGHVFFRIQPPYRIVLPYVEGLMGFTYLTTDTRIKDQSNYEEIASSKNFDDITFSYGAGGGLMIQVYQTPVKMRKLHKLNSVYIDLCVRYLKGGEAKYLKEGSIRMHNGVVLYDVEKSNTDIVTVHIGAIITF